MKKIFKALFIFLLSISLVGCGQEQETDAKKFKSDYESLNGGVNASGNAHRTVSIPEENPFVYATAEEIVEKLENGETFYVYFGSKLCPWCRSVIEKTIEVANKNNIKTIYYVDIWDDEGNEILRDKYTLENGVPTLTYEGTESYSKLLLSLDNVLEEYILTDQEGNRISINEKRIYAPNFIYIENGRAIRLTNGASEKQTNSRGELTAEILEDQEKILNAFFNA